MPYFDLAHIGLTHTEPSEFAVASLIYEWPDGIFLNRFDGIIRVCRKNDPLFRLTTFLRRVFFFLVDSVLVGFWLGGGSGKGTDTTSDGSA